MEGFERDEKTCWHCKSSSEVATKRCAKCLLARYCSPECQRDHWKKSHKVVCGSGFVIRGTRGPSHSDTLKLETFDGEQRDEWDGGLPEGFGYQYNEYFYIKVQVTAPEDALLNVLLYSNDRKVMLTADMLNCDDLQGLVDRVRGFEPFDGRKAYFRAKIVKETKSLFISSLQVFVCKW